MRKLILPLAAAAALALPASGLAWGGHHHHHHGDRNGGVLGASISINAKSGSDNDSQGRSEAQDNDDQGQSNPTFQNLSGTGTSFGNTSASITGTSFTGTLATTWSSATTKSNDDNDSDDNGSTSTNSVSCAPSTASITLGTAAADTFTGKTCSWTRDGTTKYGFFGTDSNGARAFLKEDGTTVTGAIVTGSEGLHVGFTAGEHNGSGDDD